MVEPFFRVLVELGYDRSIPPWEPTPARLIPPLNPATVATDLVNAIGEGINNAAALVGSPPPLSIPAAPSETANAGVSDQAALRVKVTDTGQAAPQEKVTDTGQAAPQEKVTDTGQAAPQEKVTDTGQAAPQEKVTDTGQAAPQEKVTDTGQATPQEKVTETIGAVKSVIGNGRTIVRSAGSDNGSTAATTSPAGKTPVRDAVKQASSDIKNVVTQVSDNFNKAPSGSSDDDDNGDGGDGGEG